MKILVLNAGSNSLKFEIVDANAGERVSADKGSSFGSTLVSGAYDDIGKNDSAFSLKEDGRVRRSERIEIRDHGHATELLFDWIERGGAKEQGINGFATIERIGHRVVHGADFFDGPVEVTDQVISQIQQLEDLAPLHNASALKVIRTARQRTDGLLMIAVFDTVFHRTIPEHAALYPLPPDLARRHKIRRYGFHGISHRYLLMRYAEITGRKPGELNLITLHLEGGSSVAAIRHGASIDTSMGFTPLEGLMMGTRCGDIDPAIVPYLMRKENMDVSRIEQFLNKECGLLAVSGESADTRELRKHLSDDRVHLALSLFSYRVRKYIGAYLAALGGADAIVAGGGISENTPEVREQIFQGFHWCGAVLDAQRNRDTVDREGPLTTPESSLPIWIVPTRETLMIAKEVAEFYP